MEGAPRGDVEGATEGDDIGAANYGTPSKIIMAIKIGKKRGRAMGLKLSLNPASQNFRPDISKLRLLKIIWVIQKDRMDGQ